FAGERARNGQRNWGQSPVQAPSCNLKTTVIEHAILTFIISMRARALAQDWDYHTWLLECTLDSILAQTNPEFNVVVACHDIPEFPQAKNPAVHMLQVQYQLPQRNFEDMLVDKVLKLTSGVDWAIARGSDYVMFVDAD